MKVTGFLSAAALAIAMLPQSVLAADAAAPSTEPSTEMSAAQKTEIQKVVHDYLLSNPEVLLEASQALQQKQQQAMQQQAQSAIKENAQELFADKFTIIGNPKGKVTLVEFFDYQCRHCKDMSPVMAELVKSDSNLRIIYKEFPIFGETSEMASKAALAAGMQGKYKAMHEALITQKTPLDEKIITASAQGVGLDMAKFKTDMASKQVTETLAANRKLAEKLKLMGTPAFIVASTPEGMFKEGSEIAFVPGAASREALQEMIKKASAS